jgi:hypothetical protein
MGISAMSGMYAFYVKECHKKGIDVLPYGMWLVYRREGHRQEYVWMIFYSRYQNRMIEKGQDALPFDQWKQFILTKGGYPKK